MNPARFFFYPPRLNRIYFSDEKKGKWKWREMISSLFSFFSYLFFFAFFVFWCQMRVRFAYIFFSTAISSSDDTEPSSKAENRD